MSEGLKRARNAALASRQIANVSVGQVWRERDRRFVRDIVVLAIGETHALVMSVTGRGIKTHVRLDRFGRRYDLREDAHE